MLLIPPHQEVPLKEPGSRATTSYHKYSGVDPFLGAITLARTFLSQILEGFEQLLRTPLKFQGYAHIRPTREERLSYNNF